MKKFVISDTHFFHKNIIKLCGRPFASVAEMNQQMVERWNTVVGPEDMVYHLGDVALWTPDKLAIVRQLNGEKHLVMGNHDTALPHQYTAVGFKTLNAVVEKHGYVLSHVPVHTMELGRFGTNLHGHIHCAQVEVNKYVPEQQEIVRVLDPRYINCCVEHMDYQPRLIEQVLDECMQTSKQEN